MERELGDIECAHRRCLCVVSAPAGPEAYCSEYCREAETHPEDEDVCLCGHPECTPEEEVILESGAG